MFDIGRLVVKIAGRDAGSKGVIVDVLDSHYVLVDGQVRRRKVNVLHLDPLNQTIPLAQGASHEEVKEAFATLGITVVDTKPKQAQERQKKVKKKKVVQEPKKKAPKKTTKKQETVAVEAKASNLENALGEPSKAKPATKPSDEGKTPKTKKKAKPKSVAPVSA